MLLLEHSAILSTFIKLPFVIKSFVLSIFEWPFYTDFTVLNFYGIYGIEVYLVTACFIGVHKFSFWATEDTICHI